MAHIVIIGAGIAGLPAAYELRKALGREHHVTLVSATPDFRFVPSNPWIAVGWRKPSQVSVPLHNLWKRDIDCIVETVVRVHPDESRVQLADTRDVFYDYLVIATGPKLAFDEVPGLGPEAHSVSICTLDHAQQAWMRYQEFLNDPGPVVIGAAQGASCFGPAYEFAMIVDADLRKRRLRHKAPLSFVTSEPYIGHLGLDGVGDSKGLLEHELRQRDIGWICNARIKGVDADEVVVTECDAAGAPLREHELPSKYTMLLPAFRGIDAVAGIEGLSNPRGFILIDEHQRNPRYRNIFAAGVCVAIAPPRTTPVPTGVPKTGYMIESMVTAIVHNIKAELQGRAAEAKGSWNAVCLADMGDHGAVFVALPQMPPRNVTWTRQGRWVHWAKILFEKYFLYKMRRGSSEPVYERLVLRLLGIKRAA